MTGGIARQGGRPPLQREAAGAALQNAVPHDLGVRVVRPGVGCPQKEQVVGGVQPNDRVGRLENGEGLALLPLPEGVKPGVYALGCLFRPQEAGPGIARIEPCREGELPRFLPCQGIRPVDVQQGGPLRLDMQGEAGGGEQFVPGAGALLSEGLEFGGQGGEVRDLGAGRVIRSDAPGGRGGSARPSGPGGTRAGRTKGEPVN